MTRKAGFGEEAEPFPTSCRARLFNLSAATELLRLRAITSHAAAKMCIGENSAKEKNPLPATLREGLFVQKIITLLF